MQDMIENMERGARNIGVEELRAQVDKASFATIDALKSPLGADKRSFYEGLLENLNGARAWMSYNKLRYTSAVVLGITFLTSCAPAIVVVPIPDGEPNRPTITQTAPIPTETATKTATATETPIATPTETNTPVPTAEEVAIALFDKYNVDPDTYTLAEVDGVIIGTDNETGAEIFRDGRFEISYAVDLAKKDCEPTDFVPYKFGSVQEKDLDSLGEYYDKLIEDTSDNDFNRFSNTTLFDTVLSFLLVDSGKQCWGLFAESDVLLYRDETGTVQLIPTIHLTKDEKTEFIINR